MNQTIKKTCKYSGLQRNGNAIMTTLEEARQVLQEVIRANNLAKSWATKDYPYEVCFRIT